MSRERDITPKKEDPAAIRSIFGNNLKLLAGAYPSVTSLCRELGINRTQFNRYLLGESFPRPDVLHQICKFFRVDARILLEPLQDLQPTMADLLNQPFLQGYFGTDATDVNEALFSSGFFRFVRRSFIDETHFATGLVYIKRENGYKFLRGFEPREAMRSQGLSIDVANREFRGLILRQEEGVMAIVTHRASLACSFNFLSPETSFQTNLWEGYATRTVREKLTGRRAARMVYEYLGQNTGAILKAARQSGLATEDQIAPFHLRLLRLNEEFR